MGVTGDGGAGGGRLGWWLDVAVGCGGGWGEAETDRQTDRQIIGGSDGGVVWAGRTRSSERMRIGVITR